MVLVRTGTTHGVHVVKERPWVLVCTSYLLNAGSLFTQVASLPPLSVYGWSVYAGHLRRVGAVGSGNPNWVPILLRTGLPPQLHVHLQIYECDKFFVCSKWPLIRF